VPQLLILLLFSFWDLHLSFFKSLGLPRKKMGKNNNCENGQKEETFENWSLMDVKQRNVNFFGHNLVLECQRTTSKM
jgi:hypothetical protein